MVFRKLNAKIESRCINCGRKFIKITWNQKNCNDCKTVKKIADQTKWNTNQKVKKLLKKNVKVCVICFGVFNVNSNSEIYCSIKCKRKGNKIKRLEQQILQCRRRILEIRVDATENLLK
jgi:hypothetical protein